jgi:integrase/recombinase XerC
MNQVEKIRNDKVFRDGERSCPICNEPLPAHETWPGARYRFCMKAECKASVMTTKARLRYVAHQQVRCGAIGCTNYVPEGRYAANPALLTCSAACAQARLRASRQQVKCRCGCGVELTRRVSDDNKEGYFASYKCHGRYRVQQYLSGNCGVFKDLIEEYLEGAASVRYRGIATVRAALVPFFHYLDVQGITCLESVTPKTITEYITWSKKTWSRDVKDHISYLSVFFKWAMAMGYREAGNPVIGAMHHSKQVRRLPRPYSDEEMDRTWHFLNTRGNARLRFTAAMGEEAGLRISEVCNLRLEDIDIQASRCFVRTPSKPNRERVAFFSEKTKCFYEEWMKVRRSDVEHDHVVHGEHGKPYSSDGLRRELNLVLCKTYHGESVNQTGFDQWSFHRLRHTMASRLASVGADAATVMAAGGWTTFRAMESYTQVAGEATRNEYQEAMRRAEEKKLFEPVTRTLSPEELLTRRAKAAVKKHLCPRFETLRVTELTRNVIQLDDLRRLTSMNFKPYLEHLAIYKQCSPQTIRAYRSDLKLFSVFAEQQSITRLDQVNDVTIRQYIEHMRQKNNHRFGHVGLSDASVARRLAALNGYFEYVRVNSNHKLQNPLKGLRNRWHKNDQPKPVDEEALDKLLAGITNERDKLLFSLFLATGLRVSELHQLNRDSIGIQATTNAIGEEEILGVGEVIGKGSKTRTFYVNEATLMLYASYLGHREDQHEALFLSERMRRLSVRAIQYTLDIWCRRLGLEHINVHRLRHSFATRMANANISSLVLKDLMGHASFSTTAKYFKLTDTTLARGYFSAMEYLQG